MPTSRPWSPCCAPSSRGASAALLVALSILLAAPAGAQDRFGIGVQLGRSDTLTPYRRNIVLAEETGEVDSQGVPLMSVSLGDEQHAWSTSFGLEVQLDDLEFTLRALWLTRDTVLRHHSGDTVISQRRERADGTYDDAGVTYTPTPEEELRIPQRGRGELLIATLGGGKRFTLYEGLFKVFVPAGGGITITNVDEPGMPYKLGLHVYTGLGVSYRFAQSLELTAATRFVGVGTLEYEPDGDAARRGAQLGEGTLDALFSTTILPDIGLTITYIVR